MPMYFYIPQNAWGLVDQEHYATVGFYSQPGGACRPVALWCEAAQRGAYTHFDGNEQAVSENLAAWLAGDSDASIVNVYANDAEHAVDIQNQILTTGVCQAAVVADANPEEYWGCHFTEAGPEWVDDTDIPAEEKTRTPASWSDYWPGAPTWMETGAFTGAIVAPLAGFIANYNGRFYFDFAEDQD
ncbi:MAG TPA: hypothetical protein VMH86_12220 [Rhizomicrobium sp.]|nr:hypothetical protein [Rhizomicrobium sp.]